MLDIKFINKNLDFVKNCIHNKGEDADVHTVVELDRKLKKLLYNFENKRRIQKQVSKDIVKLKKQGENVENVIKNMKRVAKEVKDLNDSIKKVKDKLDKALYKIPNIFDSEVPIGKSEKENKVLWEWGKEKKSPGKLLNHIEISKRFKLVDFSRAAKISGSGFACYTDKGSQLERALINFMLDFHEKNYGYKEILPPFLANRKTMTATGQLPKLEDDMYRIEEDDYFLIPTGEVPLTNLHQDEILDEKSLPIKYIAYTPCFRREAGSYGKETKGLQRMHQFNKVELVQLVKPGESEKALKEILNNAESILQELGLQYRVSLLCSGELSFAAYKCYDIEVWAPASKKYLEVSSCSNFIDYQGRRANIRFRSSEDRKVHFVHTLNGSGLATPRTLIGLLETYQVSENEIIIPEVLRPYYGESKILI